MMMPEHLGAYHDRELNDTDTERVRVHVAQCDVCTSRLVEHARLSTVLSGALVRHHAPDTLRARIRSALAAERELAPAPSRARPEWRRLAAAVLITALVTGSGTYAVTRRELAGEATMDAVVAAHVRSLMPGHLTDVASDEHHSVKPWFNGRIDVSPSVPNLDTAGFPLVGGRLDFVGDRTVAAVVYARRQHLINVFTWPNESGRRARMVTRSERGYHVIRWAGSGLETWIVSDLNVAELQQFATRFDAAR